MNLLVIIGLMVVGKRRRNRKRIEQGGTGRGSHQVQQHSLHQGTSGN